MVSGRFPLAFVAMLNTLRRVEHMWSTTGPVPDPQSKYAV
jgi:hypothetical protein